MQLINKYRCGFLLLLTLTACSGQSSADELKKELPTVTSWAATARMVGDAWTRGAVPTAYTKQTLQKTQQELQKEADTLAKKAPPQDRAALLEHLQRMSQMIGNMSTSVEQKDRTAIAKQIQQLSTEEQAITALAKAGGKQP